MKKEIRIKKKKIKPIRTDLATARKPVSILSPARTIETPQIEDAHSTPRYGAPVGVVTETSLKGK
jgi:hypothetical protein